MRFHVAMLLLRSLKHQEQLHAASRQLSPKAAVFLSKNFRERHCARYAVVD